MKITRKRIANSRSGFSLIEMLIVIAILTVITGAIFEQIGQAERNTSNQQIRLDLFQQVREFSDQMARDLRSVGYPNIRNFESGQLKTSGGTTLTVEQDNKKTAVGLVELSPNSLWYESAAQGDGTVWVIRYKLVTEGMGCPCLQRSMVQKQDGDPMDGQPNADAQYITEVQNVVTGDDSNPIFTAYDTGGAIVPATVAAPIDMNSMDASGNPTIANINSVAIKLTVRSPVTDSTGHKPEVTMIATVRLTNCSQAYHTANPTIMGC